MAAHLKTVTSDEILDELHAFREAYAAKFDYDLEKMFVDLREFRETQPVCANSSIKPVERKVPAEKDPAAVIVKDVRPTPHKHCNIAECPTPHFYLRIFFPVRRTQGGPECEEGDAGLLAS